jgi:hypothetical protein
MLLGAERLVQVRLARRRIIRFDDVERGKRRWVARVELLDPACDAMISPANLEQIGRAGSEDVYTSHRNLPGVIGFGSDHAA